jgi:hypothetical protein
VTPLYQKQMAETSGMPERRDEPGQIAPALVQTGLPIADLQIAN